MADGFGSLPMAFLAGGQADIVLAGQDGLASITLAREFDFVCRSTGRSYGSPNDASIARNVTFSNSSSRNSVLGSVSGEPGLGLTSRTCVENGDATARGKTNMTSVPMPLMALVRP